MRINRRIAGIGSAVAASVVVAALLAAQGASAAHWNSKTTITGSKNATCLAQGIGDSELKHDSGASGTATSGSRSATVTVTNGTFSWSSNFDVVGVIAKGGNGANVYRYDPATREDSGLSAPTGSGLSHVSFCYFKNPPTTSPPPSSTTTTTPPDCEKDPTLPECPPPSSTTTTPPPAADRCTGQAFDIQVKTGGILPGYVGLPVTATAKDVFPDHKTQVNESVVLVPTGATAPVLTAKALDVENAIVDGKCTTRAKIVGLAVDLNNLSGQGGAPVKLTADVIEVKASAADNGADTSTQMTLVGGSLDINGQGGTIPPDQVPPNSGGGDCFASPDPDFPGEMCVLVVFHEQSFIPNGISANGIHIKVSLNVGALGGDLLLADVVIAHAHADAHNS